MRKLLTLFILIIALIPLSASSLRVGLYNVPKELSNEVESALELFLSNDFRSSKLDELCYNRLNGAFEKEEDLMNYNYLRLLRNKEDEELRSIIEYKFNENIYKFHKIDCNFRKLINEMVIKYEEKQIYYKYIWIINSEIRKNMKKELDENDLRNEFCGILEKLYNEEIEIENIIINYKKNKKLIEEIINIINTIRRNQIDEIIGKTNC